MYFRNIIFRKEFAWYFLLSSGLLLLFIFTFHSSYSLNKDILSTYEDSKFNLIAYTNTTINDPNGYKFHDDWKVYSYRNESLTSYSKSLNVDAFGIIDSNAYDSNSLFYNFTEVNNLNDNEILLSKNIIDKYQLQIHDIVYLKIDNEVTELKIVGEINIYSSFVKPSIYNSIGVLLYKNITNNEIVNDSYIHFIDETDNVYSSLITREEVLRDIKLFNLIYSIGLLFLVVLVNVIVVLFEKNKILLRLKKSITQGIYTKLKEPLLIELFTLLIGLNIIGTILSVLILTVLNTVLIILLLVITYTEVYILVKREIRNEIEIR